MATMTIDELTKQLRDAYGVHLNSVVLYGSAAGGEHVAAKSDYNVLVLLDSIDAGSMSAASAVMRAWKDAGNPSPMIMTVAEWKRSADVFPMEYADILDQHTVLVGEPHLRDIVISRKHLRIQLESQVMGKLLRLRHSALTAGRNSAAQTDLLTASYSTIMILFRAALRLAGEKPGRSGEENAPRLATLAGFDAGPFLRVGRHRAGTQLIAGAETMAVLAGYLTGVEKLDAYLDSFPTEEL